MPSPRILFLIPYFGRWPFWLPLFLESCRRNPDINWLIFSDCGEPEDVPANVRIEAIGYDEYCRLVSQRLGIRFHPANPYKLCDIKPALGFIHEDRLQGYDFWAFGDLDLIYGQLRRYFTDERLARYDLFSTHARRVSGHLCLLRNNEKMREAFRLIKNWQLRFADEEHHAIDEGAFSRIFIRRKNFPAPLFKLAGYLNAWRRHSEFEEAFTTPNGCIPWRDGNFSFPEKWFWRDGVVSNDIDPVSVYPYFHFAVWKRGAWKELLEPPAESIRALSKTSGWIVSAQGFAEGAGQ